jgi:hypothetical protein
MSSQASRGSLILRRVTLSLLTLPPLIALALLAWATLMHQPRPISTGDALLDAYLQAVADYGEVGSVKSFELITVGGLFPSSLWQHWEKQFGDDPRFWMLCYYERPQGEAHGDFESWYGLPGAGYLLEARERGATDWSALLKLLDAQVRAWDIDARTTLGLSTLTKRSTLVERRSHHMRVWEEIKRKHQTELAQLLTEVRKAGAEQAEVHYYLAGLAAESGDMAGALEEMDAGNAAPQNDSGLGLPYDALTAAARQSQPLAGDVPLAGQLVRCFLFASRPNVVRFKYSIEVLVASAVTRQDAAVLQALHRSCCRYGASRLGSSTQAEAAIAADRRVLDALRRITSRSASARLNAANQAQSQLGQIEASLQAIPHSVWNLRVEPGVWDQTLSFSPAVSFGGRYFGLEALGCYSHDLIAEQTALAGPIRKQFEALAAIDFTQ